MLDGDSVEGLETVDGTNGIGFFLCYAEPAKVVRGVQALVYAGIHLCPNDFADLIVDTWQYRNVSLNSGGMCNHGDFNRQEVLMEVTVLGVIAVNPLFCRDMKWCRRLRSMGQRKPRG